MSKSRLPTFDPGDHKRGGKTTLESTRPLVLTTLSTMLRPQQFWKKWTAILKDYDGDWKYCVDDVNLLEMEKDPVSSIWLSLTHDARDLNYVMETLTEARLYRAADFISVNVLQGQPVPRQLGDEPVPEVLTQNLPPLVPPKSGIQFANQPASYGTLTDSSISSTDPKEFVDGCTPNSAVQYNKQIPDRKGWNIQASDEISDSANEASSVEEHWLNYNSMKTKEYIDLHSAPPVKRILESEQETVPSNQKQIQEAIQIAVNNLDLNLEPGKPHEFTYSSLEMVTNNFDGRPLNDGGQLIGKGGFGVVFLGKLKNNKEIAVKRLMSNPSKDVKKQFKDELDAMSWLVHDNLLPLLGYSSDGPNLCIVYEYMSKGSLEDALASKVKETRLSIKERLSIAKGTANGIAHLHSMSPPLVHRDIKSANILLSKNITPKIGDFGLARLDPRLAAEQQTHITTGIIIGTRVYMPPEAFDGQISPAWDCYSLGVVIQELITGLAAYDETREDRNLPTHIYESCESDEDIMDLVDQHTGASSEIWIRETATTLYTLSRKCLENKRRRFNISKIQEVLSSLDV